MSKAINLVGDRYGRLEVISAAGRSDSGMRLWLCLCDCGVSKVFRHGDVRSGKTRSCGCLRAEQIGERSKTHGKSKTNIYAIWNAMIARCENPKNDDYANYGGRGIKVCDQWRHSFSNFYADMGDRPEGLSLDRIDVNGDYQPSNCRWADFFTQAQNKRAHSAIRERDGRGRYASSTTGREVT